MKPAVVFDLDGTLTVPYLDFDVIRAEIGLPPGPILEAMEQMDDDACRRAQQILDCHERDAAENSRLQEGAAETILSLRRRGFAVGVLTRNTRQWTRYVLDKHAILVDAIRCRDDGTVKPSAEPVLRLCAELGADPTKSWVVGDHLFDLIAGTAAGARTILIVSDRGIPEYAAQADHVIRRLKEVVVLVERQVRSV
ncbi:MAG: HAD family hydrolase [Phycisphaerae bacterium]|nr:HAD family hydrolase [Phycisphaerae bacterium]